MPCYRPLIALRTRELSKTGKRPLRFMKIDANLDSKYLKQGIEDDRLVLIPCSYCIGCRLEKARQWAVRCVHEASLHEENCFITLTYNDENLPKDRSIVIKHFQNFMKKFRREIEPCRIRYFACGEYGDKLGRPHYHAIIFGYDFPDKEVFKVDKYFYGKNVQKVTQNKTLYKSDMLHSIWQKKGFVTIGEVTFHSASYVARYQMKKIYGKRAKNHYKGKVPEKCFMSLKPGIGKPWFEKYKGDVYPKDFFTINGIKQKPPTYYDYLMEADNPKLMKDLKDKRKWQGLEKEPVTYERLLDMEKFKRLQTETLGRRSGNEEFKRIHAIRQRGQNI